MHTCVNGNVIMYSAGACRAAEIPTTAAMDGTVEQWTSPHGLTLPPASIVQVWRFSYPDDFLYQWQATLDTTEACHADSYRFQRDRQRYVVRRGTLRNILAGYLKMRPEDVPIVASPTGKPELLHGEGTVKFSLSHSGSQFVVAVSDGRKVGIDVECDANLGEWAGIARHFFHEAEQRALSATPIDDRRELFLQLWTAKEAVLKARGCGLLMPLSHVCMVACIAAMARSARASYEMPDGQLWTLKSLPALSRAYGALAVEGESEYDVEWFDGVACPEWIAACFI